MTIIERVDEMIVWCDDRNLRHALFSIKQSLKLASPEMIPLWVNRISLLLQDFFPKRSEDLEEWQSKMLEIFHAR